LGDADHDRKRGIDKEDNRAELIRQAGPELPLMKDRVAGERELGSFGSQNVLGGEPNCSSLLSCPAADGVYDLAGSTCWRVVHCVFRRTTARGANGGGITASGSGALEVVDTLFIQCRTTLSYDGGGISTTTARTYLTRVCGTGCTADWGGFFCRGNYPAAAGSPAGESWLEEIAVCGCGTGGGEAAGSTTTDP
jgi:hypothetical protein